MYVSQFPRNTQISVRVYAYNITNKALTDANKAVTDDIRHIVGGSVNKRLADGYRILIDHPCRLGLIPYIDG